MRDSETHSFATLFSGISMVGLLAKKDANPNSRAVECKSHDGVFVESVANVNRLVEFDIGTLGWMDSSTFLLRIFPELGEVKRLSVGAVGPKCNNSRVKS